ncbi:MAG: hypothetical protein M3N29_04695 [Chloroflexota bacterium]|nr:hypothetical protein [Chloroflexota bacterium]
MTDSRATVAVAEPHDTCFRCGRSTPLGVPLCEHDNPGRIKGPSTTQVHGTIAVGVVAGFILLFLLFGRLTTPGAGLIDAAITGSATLADGRTQIVVRVTNGSSSASAASCRVSRGGVAGSGDIVFFTPPIPAGEAREFTRTVPPAPAGSGRQGNVFAVRCN